MLMWKRKRTRKNQNKKIIYDYIPMPDIKNTWNGGNGYVICKRSRRLANKLNVLIYPSENHKFKLEVYSNSGNFLSYIGKNDEIDYPYLIEMVKIKLITLTVARRMRRTWIERNLDNIYHNRFYWLEWRLLWS